MKVTPTAIPEVLVIEPRGFWRRARFFLRKLQSKSLSGSNRAGCRLSFRITIRKAPKTSCVVCTIKSSSRKANWCVSCRGEVFDVAVDIRKDSKTYGQWVGEILSAENKKQFWVPPGFAHGFLTLSDTAEFLYKTTDYYAPEHERAILWNDETLSIDWPLSVPPALSAKDMRGIAFADS